MGQGGVDQQGPDQGAVPGDQPADACRAGVIAYRFADRRFLTAQFCESDQAEFGAPPLVQRGEDFVYVHVRVFLDKCVANKCLFCVHMICHVFMLFLVSNSSTNVIFLYS